MKLPAVSAGQPGLRLELLFKLLPEERCTLAARRKLGEASCGSGARFLGSLWPTSPALPYLL